MKYLFIVPLLFSSVGVSSSYANAYPYCVARQKLEAKIAFAKERSLPVELVDDLAYWDSTWSEADQDNVGVDLVSVIASPQAGIGWEGTDYWIRANQIGNTDDCRITSVEKVGNQK